MKRNVTYILPIFRLFLASCGALFLHFFNLFGFLKLLLSCMIQVRRFDCNKLHGVINWLWWFFSRHTFLHNVVGVFSRNLNSDDDKINYCFTNGKLPCIFPHLSSFLVLCISIDLTFLITFTRSMAV